MQLRRLDLSKHRDRKQFIDCAFHIYRGSAQWVPPVLPEIQLVLNRSRHPYYAHSDADFFVVESDGRAVGRITVLENRNFNQFHGRQVAFFYFFDAVDDTEVSQALFDAASDWARKRGLNALIGPKGFLQGDGMGMLNEGFEHRPALGVPYNHPYYNRLAIESGFVKETDFLSGYLPGDHQLPERMIAVAEKVKKQRGFWVKSFETARELRQWVPRAARVYNQVFVENWEYCPVTDAEVKVIVDRLLSITRPELMKLVMKGDDIVGFLFAFVDISAAIQKTGGRVWPFGWYHLLREFDRTDWVNFNGTGLLPGHRGVGANAVLYAEMARTAQDCGFRHAEAVQIEEQNAKSLGDMAVLGVRWYKRHRIYRRDL